MLAPRWSAWDSSSRTRMAAPSPRTMPSRSRSKGRQASCGTSFLVDSTRMEQYAAKVNRVKGASAPPASARSMPPAEIFLKAYVAGFLRNVVARRQYPHGAICGESKPRQGSFGATGERQVDAAGGNLPEGLPQGDGPRSTGRGYRHVWSAQIELDGDMPGYRVRRY